MSNSGRAGVALARPSAVPSLCALLARHLRPDQTALACGFEESERESEWVWEGGREGGREQFAGAR